MYFRKILYILAAYSIYKVIRGIAVMYSVLRNFINSASTFNPKFFNGGGCCQGNRSISSALVSDDQIDLKGIKVSFSTFHGCIKRFKIDTKIIFCHVQSPFIFILFNHIININKNGCFQKMQLKTEFRELSKVYVKYMVNNINYTYIIIENY